MMPHYDEALPQWRIQFCRASGHRHWRMARPWAGCGMRFHERGASVAVNVRDRERAENAGERNRRARLCSARRLAANGVPDDIAQRTVERFGRIDILVNNAALPLRHVSRSHRRRMAQSDRGQPHRAVLDDESRSSANARPTFWPHH